MINILRYEPVQVDSCASDETGYIRARSEQGSTLIAVLLILLVITILGITAMRQGLMTLSISTNAQAHQLLVQSTDTVLNTFTQTNINTLTSLTGVMGLALVNGPGLPGQEYVFCYRPTSSQAFAQGANANVITAGSGDQATLVNGGNGGFCDLTADFGSARQAVVTQVAVTVPTDPAPVGAYLLQGSWSPQLPGGIQNPQRVRVTATAILPAFSNTTVSTVQSTCMGGVGGSSAGRISDNTNQLLSNPTTATESLTDCLARLGVPANTQVQEYSAIATLTPSAS